MRIKLERSYRSAKTGNPVFVYSVTGSDEDLNAFKEAQGQYYRTDESTGNPLWFTTRCVGPQGSLIITTKGNIVPDMSKFDQAASLAAQYGGNFGDALAQAMVSDLTGGNTASAPASAPAAQAEESNEGLGEL